MLESRIKARRAGEKRFEGIRCMSCHTTTKYTSSGSCVKCAGVRRDAEKKRDRVKRKLAIPLYSKDAPPIADMPKPPKMLKPWPVMDLKPEELQVGYA